MRIGQFCDSLEWQKTRFSLCWERRKSGRGEEAATAGIRSTLAWDDQPLRATQKKGAKPAYTLAP